MLARWSLVTLVGCAAAPKHAIAVAVLADGDSPALAANAVEGLELHAVALPAPAAPPPDDRAAAVTRARSAYASGDFATCRGALGDETEMLAANQRPLAARTLMLKAACAWPDKAAAEAIAKRFAGFGLDLPDLQVTPDVERAVTSAITDAGKTPRKPLAISGIVGARLAIDGRPGGCALPCTVDLPAGDHVIAVEADGYAPASRVVRTPQADRVGIAQEPASPELAGLQWRARIGRGLPATDAVGVALIARLAGTPRVAFIHADGKLTGAMIVDGRLAATGTADAKNAPGLVRELAYDARLLHRPSVFQRPWFWIATTGAAIAIAGAIVYVAVRDTDTGLRF